MAEDAASTTDLFEIIRTTRSMRRLKQDPVPDALIRKVLEAGVCAPSGGNMQRWRFLVIRDATIKQTVGAYYKRAWDEVVGPHYRTSEPAPGMDRDRFQRLVAAADHLAAHFHEAPVWIVPCLQGDALTRTTGSSIYPAVQNMLLAARVPAQNSKGPRKRSVSGAAIIPSSACSPFCRPSLPCSRSGCAAAPRWNSSSLLCDTR